MTVIEEKNNETIRREFDKYQNNGGKLTFEEYNRVKGGVTIDKAIVGKSLTEKQLLALYPIVVSENCEKREDLDSVIKWMIKKNSTFCLVSYFSASTERFTILRKKDKGELIKLKPKGCFSNRKIRAPRVEVLEVWEAE